MGMFKNAATISGSTGKASKSAPRKELPIEGLSDLAAINAMMTALEGLKASIETSVKAQAFNSFMSLTGVGVKPDSFTGIEKNATGSMELRKRGTNSALSTDEAAVLVSHGITPFKEVIAPELFGINPKYAGDEEIMLKVEQALSEVDDLPEDFIVKQEEKSKLVVSEANMTEAFAAKNKLSAEAYEALVRIVTTQAVKPKTSDSFEAIADRVKAMMTKDESEVEEA